MKTLSNVPAMITLVVIMVSCKGLAKDLQTMTKLQDTISKRFDVKGVGIKISNGKTIFVSFTNTQYNDSQPAEKQKMAYEVGKIVLKTLDKDNKIESGRLSFVESTNHTIVTTSKSVSFNMRLDSLANIPLNDSIHNPKPITHDL